MAVNAVLLGFTASNCIVFGQYVLFALRVEPTPVLQKSLAVALLTFITIIHGCFLRTGIFVQNVLGWIKVALIVFMVSTGLFVVLVRPETTANSTGIPSQMASWNSLWEGTIWNWGTISTALFKVFYSYAGLENVNNVLNEVKNPVKTLKSVATAALVTACILYLLVNVAYFLVVPLDEITNSGELIAALFFEKTFGPTVGRTILPLAVAVSAGGNVMVVTFALVCFLLSLVISYVASICNVKLCNVKPSNTLIRPDSTKKLPVKASYHSLASYLRPNPSARLWEG